MRSIGLLISQKFGSGYQDFSRDVCNRDGLQEAGLQFMHIVFARISVQFTSDACHRAGEGVYQESEAEPSFAESNRL